MVVFRHFLFSGHGGTRRPSGRREHRWIVSGHLSHPDQVAGSPYQLSDKVGPGDSKESALSESAHGLHPSKGFFDPFADPLTGAVTFMPGGAFVDSGHRATPYGQNIRPTHKSFLQKDL